MLGPNWADFCMYYCAQSIKLNIPNKKVESFNVIKRTFAKLVAYMILCPVEIKCTPTHGTTSLPWLKYTLVNKRH